MELCEDGAHARWHFLISGGRRVGLEADPIGLESDFVS